MALRRAVHNVMAAICQVDLRYYRTVLQEFYASPVPAPDQSEILRASVTDDTKDDVQHGEQILAYTLAALSSLAASTVETNSFV